MHQIVTFCIDMKSSSLCSIGEMAAHAPISGTYPHYAARWVDPALGFAVGWNSFYVSKNRIDNRLALH